MSTRKREPHWLEPPIILAVQEELLAEFGGLPGVRDQGLLDSALNRPRHLFQYGDPDLFELAAAYAHGIANNHPFCDGNKRAAFMAAYTFLETNDQHFNAEETQVVTMTLGLADKSVSQSRYAVWLRENCQSA
jgi:death on curing protein